jgi:carboxylate-amine ligase
MTVRSVGVEEELLLVEPGTGQPLAVAETALRTVDVDDGRQEGRQVDARESLEFELQQQQLETSTEPCFELSKLGEELRRGRSLAAEVAGRADARVAALATSPVHVEPQLVRTGRYLQMAHAFGLTAYEQLTPPHRDAAPGCLAGQPLRLGRRPGQPTYRTARTRFEGRGGTI